LVISHKATLWDTDDVTHQGIVWDGDFGTNEQEVIEQKTAIGTGTYVKQVGKKPTQITLNLIWRTTNPSALLALLESESDGRIRTLTTPLITALNCRLASVSNVQFRRTEVCGVGGYYMVAATLNYVKYPVAV
jgi:hypothetical protein